MSQSLGSNIADALQLSLGYAQRLQAGITAEQFARFAAPGGHIVQSNHPAFILGHLSLYAPVILRQLGRDAADPSEAFTAVFSKDAQCVDDPEGSIYPAMTEVVQTFEQGYADVATALRAAGDVLLQKDNPTPGRLSELFPTLGSMHAFYVGGHMMLHLGQLSAWRRMQGLGPA